jgi:mRNA interferase MazF
MDGRMEVTREITRGGIYWTELESNSNSVQAGRRPVIVISNYLNNRFSPTVNVIPITSAAKNDLPVHVKVDERCGMSKKSIALVEQQMTIPKNALSNKIGTCTFDVMRKIEKALMIQQGISDPFDIDRVKRLRYALKLSHINKDTITQNIIEDEIKWYCEQYGLDYTKAIDIKSLINNDQRKALVCV